MRLLFLRRFLKRNRRYFIFPTETYFSTDCKKYMVTVWISAMGKIDLYLLALQKRNFISSNIFQFRPS